MENQYSSVPHIANTLGCVTATISGVPVGTQMAWLSINSTGMPFDKTRVDPMTNCAVTHGPFAAIGGGSGQPAITYGVGRFTIGCPLTRTRGFGAVGVACPPWAQSTVAPTCRRNPGTRTPPYYLSDRT